MLVTNNLQKTFLTNDVEATALYGIDLEIKQGEFVAIMGPSGCGKTTLLNILGLIDSPSKGKYFFDGVEVSSFDEAQRTKLRSGNIGFVFQSFNLIDELTVFENIELPLLYLRMPKSERKNKVLSLLERMNMMHRRNQFPQQLSGGQQQRVAIARAIIAEPKLVLADEPTGNLDSSHGDEVMAMLEELNKQGTTIVMVTHSLHYAGYASKTINLFDGLVVTEDVKQRFYL